MRKGDTLLAIAHRLHVSAPELRKANGLGKGSTLRIGMTLRAPGSLAKASAKTTAKKAKAAFGGDTYTVRAGDNDWKIASHLGVKRAVLHKLNPSVDWKGIRPGTALRLPSGKAVAAVAAPRLRSRYAVVVKDGTTVRRAWSRKAPRVATVSAGSRVAVLARQGEWYKARFAAGTVGWVRGDLLKATAAPKVAARPTVHTATVTYVAAMRRKKATPSRAQRVAKWQKHAQNVRARYVRIWSRQQRKYVVAPLLNGAGDVIAQAETFKGVRYSWGRASRSGTDCSGFTTQVFRREGVKLPRTSRQQALVGAKVDRGHLDKGDLIFFRTGRGRRISHVGIYMGEGKFIHASSGGGKVQVNTLSGYYSNRFVTGRRLATKKKVAKKAEESRPAEAASSEPPVAAEETATSPNP